MVRILGLDPSLSSTGWGIIEVENNRMRYVADGFIPTDTKLPLPERLAMILHTLENVIELYKPDEAAIEQVFLNSNPTSTIKLGMARGVVIMTPALYNIPVTEYEPNKIKKRSSVWAKRKRLRLKRWLKYCFRGANRRTTTPLTLWRLPFVTILSEQ